MEKGCSFCGNNDIIAAAFRKDTDAAMKSQKVIWPEHYPEFSCMGPACSDNCCHDWPIDLDRDTYLAYQQIQDPELSTLCRQYVSKIQSGGTKAQFARILPGPQGRCPFQDKDGGCKWIRRAGPQALGMVCTLYPRRKTEFLPGTWELSLSLSCAQAVRIGVLTPDRIRFVSTEITPEIPLSQMDSVGIGPMGIVTAPPNWAPALRYGILELMGRRDLSIPCRILAILLLLDRVSKTSKDAPLLLQLVSAFVRIEPESVEQAYASLHFPESAVLAAWQLPISHILAGRPGGLPDTLRSWLPEGGLLDHQGVRRCLELVQQTGDPLLSHHCREVENYFRNHLFSAMFPLLESPTDFSMAAAALAEQYALLRLLTALAAQRSKDSEEILITAIVHLSRMIQHTDHPAELFRLGNALGLDPGALRNCFL